MPIRTRSFSDGISEVTHTTFELRPGRGKHAGQKYLSQAEMEQLKAHLKESMRGATYEGAIGGAERYWRSQPEPVAEPDPLTKGWYRNRILRDIEWVRRIVALRTGAEPLNKDNLENWVVEALNLGSLVEEAKWRFGAGDTIRLGAKVRSGGRKGGKTTGKARSEAAASLNIRIASEAEAYRNKHPKLATHSTRALALHLSRKLGIPFNTIRRRLAGLNLR